MKHRAIMFASAALLFSSFAYADNLTDAPLVTSDPYATVGQQENQAKQASPGRKRSKQKDESASAKAKSQNSTQDNPQQEPSNAQYPATQGNFAGNH